MKIAIYGASGMIGSRVAAEALARGIPRAELLPLEGVGHQLPPRPWWPSTIAAILRLDGHGRPEFTVFPGIRRSL